MKKNEWKATKEELKEALEKIQREIDYIHGRLKIGIHSDFWPNRLKELESQKLDKRAILMLMEKMDELGLTGAKYIGRYEPVEGGLGV